MDWLWRRKERQRVKAWHGQWDAYVRAGEAMNTVMAAEREAEEQMLNASPRKRRKIQAQLDRVRAAARSKGW
jgi:regulator of protease activity HflC (stomatin/prohibitin superfamily)